MFKFPREEQDDDWVISVLYLKEVRAKIDDNCVSYLGLEEIEAVLLALEGLEDEGVKK